MSNVPFNVSLFEFTIVFHSFAAIGDVLAVEACGVWVTMSHVVFDDPLARIPTGNIQFCTMLKASVSIDRVY
jgi:hypothetical protein